MRTLLIRSTLALACLAALPAMAEDGGPARNNDAFVIPTMG